MEKVHKSLKSTDYSDLKHKTIFDFCNDEKMIKNLVVSKEAYFREIKRNPVINAHVLIEYAEITNNKELLHAVKKQYKEELAKIYNE